MPGIKQAGKSALYIKDTILVKQIRSGTSKGQRKKPAQSVLDLDENGRG